MSQVQGRGPTWAVLVMSKVGLRGDQRSEGGEVLDPLRQALDNSMQSHNLYQHPQHLAFHVSAPVGLLGPLPHLSSFVLQTVHSLFPPLSFQENGAKAERNPSPFLLSVFIEFHLGRSSRFLGYTSKQKDFCS
uniref:Uncharacterized protein n=2 Tax=Pan TaxID=9596 RepID=A0A2I3S2W4_PANTR